VRASDFERQEKDRLADYKPDAGRQLEDVYGRG
jgi:hypothetical protein